MFSYESKFLRAEWKSFESCIKFSCEKALQATNILDEVEPLLALVKFK